MTIDKAKLKALAEAASKEPKWYHAESFGLSRVTDTDTRSFISLSGPATILELLAEADQLKAENEDLRCVDPSHEDVLRLCKVLGYLGVSTPESGEEAAARWLRLVRTLVRTAETSKLLRQDADKVAAYERLKAENAGYRTGYEAYERENAELRKDAERYRWLRDGAGYCDTRDIPGMAPARMDAFIDAAMSKEAGSQL